MTDSAILLPVTPEAHRARAVIRRIAFVALAAILLGLVMQLGIVAIRWLAGDEVHGTAVLANAASTVTWSFLVCSGVAIGVSLGRARAALAGLLGFVFAPLALAFAKSAQKLVGAMVEASAQPALLQFELVGIVRALEYGVLAFALAVLSERKTARLAPYLWVGGAVGLIGGGLLSVLTVLAADSGLAASRIATTALSEIGFPIGCALLIYLGQLVGHSFAALEKGGLKTEPRAK